jgi:hypothetical protein
MESTAFIEKVLHILNESDASINGAELVGSDNTSVTAYIQKLFPSAWRRAVKLFPRSWFITKSFADQQKVVDAPDGTGYVLLPTDFLLLSAFKMKGWKQSCLTALEETPAINTKQANEYLRGCVQKPVCVFRYISYNNTLRQALYYYSLPRTSDATTHIVETALYIPNVTTLGADVDINYKGIEPLAYLVAATVLSNFEKDTAAKGLESKILEMM